MTAPAHKILVAEDDEQQRREIGVFLRRNGFAVVCVEDGYQATEFTLREKPDLLVLDVHMPAGDGFSVHERVQRHPDLALVPVIYMTHEPTPEIEDLARAEHASLMHKPVDHDKLLELVQAALDPTSAEAT